jgi:flagellar motor switch protein FliN/FliY
VPVQISVVLGKTSMPLNQLLKLGRGAVVELERAVGEPIDVYVNDKMVAKGEIVIVDNKIGVTLTEVIAGEKDSGKSFR